MISCTEISRNYPSLWKQLFPFINRLARKCNLQKISFNDYLHSQTSPARRALVNELSFRLFKEIINCGYSSIPKIPAQRVEEIKNETYRYIQKLNKKAEPDEYVSDTELNEAKELAGITFIYFKTYEPGRKPIISPTFFGCGAISECQGDVLIGNTLYEIKAGDRDFRVSDLKQVLIYCALDFSHKNSKIKNIGLLNPRLGIYVILSLTDAVEIASGQNTVDCFTELVNIFTTPDDYI
ncbi:hypothetical protein [Aeromonas veronii]|uniref:hypothetical protein n=1 Tax=Aeromonas veronii TaxID=654 RepID=UPI0019200F43|nr:hypothetical protein [Aeromonas veronii]MBL0591456.1 hypothetical protein [Aeromonas veronii]